MADDHPGSTALGGYTMDMWLAGTACHTNAILLLSSLSSQGVDGGRDDILFATTSTQPTGIPIRISPSIHLSLA